MKETPFKLVEGSWGECQQECATIRRRVFVVEQAVPERDEWDGLDEGATHFLIYSAGQPVACSRLVALSSSSICTSAKITRMAVLPPHRRKGLGRTLLLAMIKRAQESGCQQVVLDAQVQARTFYTKEGFKVVGHSFMDAGIEHVKMIKQL